MGAAVVAVTNVEIERGSSKLYVETTEKRFFNPPNKTGARK